MSDYHCKSDRPGRRGRPAGTASKRRGPGRPPKKQRQNPMELAPERPESPPPLPKRRPGRPKKQERGGPSLQGRVAGCGRSAGSRGSATGPEPGARKGPGRPRSSSSSRGRDRNDANFPLPSDLGEKKKQKNTMEQAPERSESPPPLPKRRPGRPKKQERGGPSLQGRVAGCRSAGSRGSATGPEPGARKGPGRPRSSSSSRGRDRDDANFPLPSDLGEKKKQKNTMEQAPERSESPPPLPKRRPGRPKKKKRGGPSQQGRAAGCGKGAGCRGSATGPEPGEEAEKEPVRPRSSSSRGQNPDDTKFPLPPDLGEKEKTPPGPYGKRGAPKGVDRNSPLRKVPQISSLKEIDEFTKYLKTKQRCPLPRREIDPELPMPLILVEPTSMRSPIRSPTIRTPLQRSPAKIVSDYDELYQEHGTRRRLRSDARKDPERFMNDYDLDENDMRFLEDEGLLNVVDSQRKFEKCIDLFEEKNSKNLTNDEVIMLTKGIKLLPVDKKKIYEHWKSSTAPFKPKVPNRPTRGRDRKYVAFVPRD